VGNAFDGRRLDLGQAVRRWVGLGAPLQLAGLVPALASLVSGVSLLWWIALLLSTAVSPTKQGLHDRLANSAMVQPADAGSGVVVLGCLVLVAVTVLMPILALIFLGPQIQEILSEVGSSI
jgi:RDD family